MKNIIFVVCAMLLTVSQSQGFEFDPSVKRAHESYARGDFKAMAGQIRQALTAHGNHPVIVKNMTALLNKAYESGNLKNVTVDWSMPEEVNDLKIMVRRVYVQESGRVRFNLAATAGLDKGAQIEQFQIIRYPNDVVIDKSAKVGEWVDESYDGYPVFWTTGARGPETVRDGLYLVNIKVGNRPMTQGWFILSDMNSSASPVLERPVLNQVFRSTQPTFSWREFKSPEFDGSEYRRATMSVDLNTDDYKEEFWVKLKSPAMTKFKVGDKDATDEYQGKKELAPGSYAMTLIYSERRKFGDITLARDSATRVPFKIE